MSNAQGAARWGGLSETSSERAMRGQLASSSVTQFRQAVGIARQAGTRPAGTGADSIINSQALLGASAELVEQVMMAASLPTYYDAR